MLDGLQNRLMEPKIAELEARRDALRNRLAISGDNGIRLHPNMADYYHAQIAGLRAALTEPVAARQAAELSASSLTGSN